jgi:phospholipase/carboxylesterase
MQDDLILQQPTRPQQLVLLFHGVGSKASDLAPLGRTLAPHMPDALIVSVQAPDAQGSGWQWFSVRGVTEANRPARVAETMQRFVQAVRDWQQASGVDSARTILIGFSQGAIMVLESTQQSDPLAGRVFALAGRFAQPPHVAPINTLVHLMHGDADPVMPLRLAVDALGQLRALGGQATLDRFPGLGHGVDTRVQDAIVVRLRDVQSRAD